MQSTKSATQGAALVCLMWLLQLVQVDAVFASVVFNCHPTKRAEGTRGDTKLDEPPLGLAPDSLGLEVGQLALFGFDVRMRNLIGHVRALSGQWAYASHDGLQSF